MNDRTDTTTNPQAGHPQTLGAQRLVNGISRVLLRTPLLSRLIGKYLVVVFVVGRKTGRRYDIPVAYTRHEGDLLIGTGFGWGRNLRTGEPVEILLAGKRRLADVRVFTDEDGVVENYAIICRANRQFASFNKIRLNAAGDPEPADLHAAWAAGARAVRLTPR